MNKRVLATLLWALTTLCFYELAWSLIGVPRMIGPMLAVATGALVYADPLRLLWQSKSPVRRIARIADAAVPADSKAVNSPS